MLAVEEFAGGARNKRSGSCMLGNEGIPLVVKTQIPSCFLK
jgi:hypothetical protein